MSLSQKLKSLGSSPRSSEGIYKKANEKAESVAEAAASLFSSKDSTTAKKSSITDKMSSLFSSKPTASQKAASAVESAREKASSLFSSKPTASQKAAAAVDKAAALFAPNKTPASRLISVPKETLTSAVSSASVSLGLAKPSGGSFWRYLIIFIIIGFLGTNLLLFLIKPADKDITHLYDPILNIFKGGAAKPDEEKKEKAKKPTPAIKKLEKVIDKKPVVNKIDSPNAEPVKNNKKLPVIPLADDSTSSVQKPVSKSGFCYIGEDRGFRSCINVGEGDVCMSGDIFPTEAICINPNLRE
jgi:hypothetical protein